MKIKTLLISFLLVSTLSAQFKEQIEVSNYIELNKNSILLEKKEKSKTLAFFLSLAIPGLGEYYLNRVDIGKYFLIAEGGW
ncbi:MAG: hypothetical protein ACK4G1_01620, partial [Ignavibacteria bacterium]